MNIRCFLVGLLMAASVLAPPERRPVCGQEKLQGICFSAVRDGESPSLQIDSLPSSVEQDVAFASRITSTIRTYSMQGSSFLLPEFCDRYKLGCVVGAWIGKSRWQNDAQIEKIIYVAKQKHPGIRSLLIGNEVLHRGDCSADQMIEYVRKVKAQTDLPVGIAETWHAWHDHPQVAKEVDIVAVQAYPYWEGMPIEGAAQYTVDRVLEIQRMFPGKQVILSEFGWPTAGGELGKAVASPENAARYLQEILPLLKQSKIEYYYFALWDEGWKVGPEGGVGAHWGIFKSEGVVKPEFKKFIPSAAVAGIVRPARTVTIRLATDDFRNSELLQVAYPSEEKSANDPLSAERGPGLQAVRGSGIRIELPIGQSSFDDTRDEDLDNAEKGKDDRPNSQEVAQPKSKGTDENTAIVDGDERIIVENSDIEKIAESAATDESLGQVKSAPLAANELFGICLSLFRDNESPHFGVVPLISEIVDDVEHARLLARAVRTYSVTDSFGLVPEICQSQAVDCVPGAALGKYPWLNDMEIEMLIRIGKSGNPRVKALIVGNEVMHRGDFSLEQYIQYIRRVKRAVTVPVATAELLHTWLEHPELADEVDILGVQIYPYWGGLAIESAAEDTLLRVQELQRAHPNQRVMLTEFGWPSDGGTLGGAIANPENAARYYRETIPLLNRNGVEYFYFAMTDERWKQGDEGGPGPHWGLLESKGTIKPEFESMVPKEVGIERLPRKIQFDE